MHTTVQNKKFHKLYTLKECYHKLCALLDQVHTSSQARKPFHAPPRLTRIVHALTNTTLYLSCAFMNLLAWPLVLKRNACL